MAISRSVCIGLAACFFLGAAAGGAGGWHFAHAFMLNAWVQEQAGDVNGDVEALRRLRSGNADGAIEFLETRLDDDLVTLEPEGYRLDVSARTEMYAALRAAKLYRGEHPRSSRRGIIDQAVRNVLSQEIAPVTK